MAKRTRKINNKRGNTKKKYRTKRKKKTKRKKRGGARDPFKSRRAYRVAAGLNPDGPDPRIVEQVRLQETEQNENPLAFNILNKFFKEVDGWFGRKSYELNPTKFGPDNKINVISAHGLSVPEKFIVVPDGLILYLPVAAGDVVTVRAVGSDPNKLNYIRGYKGGSLIQDYLIYFYPLYRNHDIFTTRGLIKLDLPHLSVKNATEANAKLIDFLTRQLKIAFAFGDQLADRIDKEKSGNIRVHLEEYAPIYFENNIDDIINKNDLIESATEQKQYYLSDILRLIARKRKGNSSISGEWFGIFCRSGEFIDINTFKRCQNIGLPPLPEGFFQGNFHYEGVDLVRQESLASSDPTINFKKILNEVFEKREQYDDNGWKKSFKERIEGIKKSVDNNEVILRQEVCFVFQMKQKYL
jgi:hypothetical protein